MHGFNIKYESDTSWKHSFFDFGVIMDSKQVPATPSITLNTLKIPNSNKVIKQEKSYGSRYININCSVARNNRYDSENKLQELIYKLSQPFMLYFDDNSNLIYYAELNKEINVDDIINAKKFTLKLICIDGFRYSIYEADNPTWDDEYSWNSNFAWDKDYSTEFSNITDTTNITIENAGTYNAYPIIEIAGSCDAINISCNGITTSYSNLNENEIVRIDCKEYEVTKEVNGDITNALLNWSGDFLYLTPGTNEIQITGTNLNITSLKFRFRYTFL